MAKLILKNYLKVSYNNARCITYLAKNDHKMFLGSFVHSNAVVLQTQMKSWVFIAQEVLQHRAK